MNIAVRRSWTIFAIGLSCLISSIGCKQKTTPKQRTLQTRGKGPMLIRFRVLPKPRTKTNTSQRPLAVLSAFFGLDNALPGGVRWLCRKGVKKDGMPLVMSEEIDQSTLQASDFQVVTKSGKTHTPLCATLRPAGEEDEDRTILLIGELGDAKRDPPVKVKIVGSLLSEDGRDFQGKEANVTPLAKGPSLILALSHAPGVQKGSFRERITKRLGRGSDCPRGTKQIIRVVWAGGVRKVGGKELRQSDRSFFRVAFDQQKKTVTPFALADLNDNDNNVDLCFRTTKKANAVSVSAGLVIDPRGDKNPATSVKVTPYKTVRKP